MRSIAPIPGILSLLVLGYLIDISYAQGTPRIPDNWTYTIPNTIQTGPSQATFEIPTPNQILDTDALLSLDKLQVSKITDAAFDWWYFDTVSETDPRESLVVTFFAASTAAFPFINSTDSVLIAYIWATFANGTIVANYIPATTARVTGGRDADSPSAGTWGSTGVRWRALEDDLSQYEIVFASTEVQIEGRILLSSRAAPHVPCGVQRGTTPLEIAPHIGWANPIPDAMGDVDVKVQGTSLRFRGPAYHDKNWSDRPFAQSVQTWYWGHGQLGPYSIVWFSYLGLQDPETTYVSSFVAREGKTLVSSCEPSAVLVRPTGTGARYPPHGGDVPSGFRVVFDLGDENACLRVNVSVQAFIGGDGEFYLRWTGNMTGDVVDRGPGEVCVDGHVSEDVVKREESLEGIAIFEQFAMLE